MFGFWTLALISFQLVNGGISSHEGFDFKSDEVTNNRRFTFEDGEYEISTFGTDWYSARNQCKMQGGKLLSIETLAENSAVLQAISGFPTESYWTSGSDIENEELFYWDTTGASMDNFTFWGPAQPDNANNTEHCVELSSEMSHVWADANCDLDRFVICEFHPCSEREVLSGMKTKEDPLLTFTFGNGTYVIPNNLGTWVDAKNMCKLMGMELVSIETFEEDLAISEATIVSLKLKSFWTSGSNLGHLGTYYWEGTGRNLGSYTGWAPREPSSVDRFHCIYLSSIQDHMWNDAPCDIAYNYICEQHPCEI